MNTKSKSNINININTKEKHYICVDCGKSAYPNRFRCNKCLEHVSRRISTTDFSKISFNPSRGCPE